MSKQIEESISIQRVNKCLNMACLDPFLLFNKPLNTFQSHVLLKVQVAFSSSDPKAQKVSL